MKKLMMVLALLTANFAHATMTSSSVERANLTGFYFQSGSLFDAQKFNRGSVVVDRNAQELRVEMYHNITCPAGTMCPMYFPAPTIVRVQLKSVRIGECNEVIYSGKSDLRPADGILQEITVTDNRTFNCESYRAVSPTEVVVTLQGGRQALSESHFLEASVLRRVN